MNKDLFILSIIIFFVALVMNWANKIMTDGFEFTNTFTIIMMFLAIIFFVISLKIK